MKPGPVAVRSYCLPAQRGPAKRRSSTQRLKELVTLMPRYVVERTFPSPLEIPVTADGAAAMQDIVNRNLEHGVTWVHSYVGTDRTRTVCVYDGPSPEAVRQAARANDLPLDSIIEVRVLDPYFFTGGA